MVTSSLSFINEMGPEIAALGTDGVFTTAVRTNKVHGPVVLRMTIGWVVHETGSEAIGAIRTEQKFGGGGPKGGDLVSCCHG
jgi:hypothetical protein